MSTHLQVNKGNIEPHCCEMRDSLWTCLSFSYHGDHAVHGSLPTFAKPYAQPGWVLFVGTVGLEVRQQHCNKTMGSLHNNNTSRQVQEHNCDGDAAGPGHCGPSTCTRPPHLRRPLLCSLHCCTPPQHHCPCQHLREAAAQQWQLQDAAAGG